MNVKMPTFAEVEDYKRQWTHKHVEVDASRPELKRFAGRVGRVITVNMSGRALVQFDEADGWGWGRFDIALPFLKQVAAPVAVAGEKPAKAAAPAAKQEGEPAAKPAAAAPGAKKSPLDQMRAAAAAKQGAGPSKLEQARAAAAAKAESTEDKPSKLEQLRAQAATKATSGDLPKPSKLDQIRAAAAKKAEGAAEQEPADAAAKPAEEPPKSDASAPGDTSKKPAGGLSKIEMIRQAAAKKAAEKPPGS